MEKGLSLVSLLIYIILTSAITYTTYASLNHTLKLSEEQINGALIRKYARDDIDEMIYLIRDASMVKVTRLNKSDMCNSDYYTKGDVIEIYDNFFDNYEDDSGKKRIPDIVYKVDNNTLYKAEYVKDLNDPSINWLPLAIINSKENREESYPDNDFSYFAKTGDIISIDLEYEREGQLYNVKEVIVPRETQTDVEYIYK